MPATKTQNARVKVVSQWLNDEFGEEGERDIDWSKDATDLIKFLGVARGWVINPHKHPKSRSSNDQPRAEFQTRHRG